MMKKLLAILNIVATIPLASLAIGIFLVGYVVKPIDDSGTVGSIGGADGPTSIFIANEPGAYAPWCVLLYVSLLACNAIVFWKDKTPNEASQPIAASAAQPEAWRSRIG